jgi:endonuclease/exonuclease/phosphatase family metal-dependent hydrolase
MNLKILTWNIAWGYGLGSEGAKGYHTLPLSHFDSSLSAMGDLIRTLNVDVVLLQEVDFAAKRSHFIPELDIISRKSGLLYRAEEVSWDHAYVPFPGLNPANQFGKIKSGGGILSRHPIQSIFSEHLPKPKENSALYNWFYLSRYLQMVEIAGVRFCNLHLEAFSKDNRALHQVKFQNRLIDYQIDIAGGDFNGSIDLSPDLQTTYDAHPSPEPTSPSQQPNETLDGFVVQKNRFKNVSVKTLNTGTVSDHFALLLEVETD